MECAIREFDKVLIRGLRSSDASVHELCVRRVFYEELEPLLRSVQCSLFKGTVEYDDLVNDLYLYLSRNNWKILDSFQGRCGAKLSTWLSQVVWHYFMKDYKRGRRIDYVDALTPFDSQVCTISAEEMRLDIEHTLARMPNERYVKVICLLIIEGRDANEVAGILDTSVQNVYLLKHRAIAQFLEIYNS